MRGRRSTSSVARELCPGAGAAEADPTLPGAFAQVEGFEVMRRAMIATVEIEPYSWQVPGKTGDAMELLLSGAHASPSEGRSHPRTMSSSRQGRKRPRRGHHPPRLLATVT
jgi:hypothetical protein